MDLTTEILRAGTLANVRKVAMVDLLARAKVVFAHATPDALEIQQWVFGLQHGAPHLFEDKRQATDSPGGLPPAPVVPGPARKRGPAPVVLTDAQAAELETLPPSARLTKYREYQAAKGKTPQATS